MEALLIYLLKSAGLLSLFYLAYYSLLKNDTNFKVNRFFLLAGIASSLFLPFLEFTRIITVETVLPAFTGSEVSTTNVSVPHQTEWNGWQIGGLIYLSGLLFFLLKLFRDLFSLLHILKTSKVKKLGRYHFLSKEENIQPFSFFKYIVFNQENHSEAELQMILEHEKAHVHQWHSIDRLGAHLMTCFFWFNPFSWLYRRAVTQNLEYLADREVLTANLSKKAYQHLLLQVAVPQFEPALSNPFYQSFIKKRIMMLHKNPSQKSTFWKSALVLPFLFLFLFTFNVKTEARGIFQEKFDNNLEISAIVTKTSEEKNLRKLEKMFAKQGVELKFSELKYSEENLLTNLHVSFLKTATGRTGDLKLNNPNGITSLRIAVSEDEVTLDPEYVAPEETPATKFSSLGKAPLYFIQSKQYATSQLTGKLLEIKDGWQVLTPAEAVEKFGKKAEDGAVIIPEGSIAKDYKSLLDLFPKGEFNLEGVYIEVKNNSKPVLMSVKIKATKNDTSPTQRFSIPETGFTAQPDKINASEFENSALYIQKNQPLYMVDGEEKDKDFVTLIDPKTIKSINVLKGKSAVDKYGKKAADGVIEITLKTEEEISEKSSEGKTVSINELVNDPTSELSKALIVVDGKVMPADFILETLDTKIHGGSIMILKGPAAIDKYGEKAKHGAVIIKTKE